MEEEITLSSSLERIKDAVDDIRTAVDMEDDAIEDVADAVEVLADNEYNAYKVNTIIEMGAISPDKLKLGDMCIVTDENYSYIPYYTNALTRVLTFPESFSTSVEPEEFTDVDFSVYSNGSALTAGGNVSLTKGGGSGSGSGSGSSGPTLCFELSFSSTDPTRPCEPFHVTVVYVFNETENKWVRNTFTCWDPSSSAIIIIHNTIIFPIECGFKKVNGGNLPSIITDCVKLHSHQIDPKASITSETLSRACIYDGFFLPFEITTTFTPVNNNEHWRNTYNNNETLSVAPATNSIGIRSENRWNISIKYINDGSAAHKVLSEIKIQDANTGNYVYNYTNYNTTYPNYDFYVYFPERNEYYLYGQVGWLGELFQQVTMQMPRTYEYQSVEPSSVEPDITAWVRQN